MTMTYVDDDDEDDYGGGDDDDDVKCRANINVEEISPKKGFQINKSFGILVFVSDYHDTVRVV